MPTICSRIGSMADGGITVSVRFSDGSSGRLTWMDGGGTPRFRISGDCIKTDRDASGQVARIAVSMISTGVTVMDSVNHFESIAQTVRNVHELAHVASMTAPVKSSAEAVAERPASMVRQVKAAGTVKIIHLLIDHNPKKPGSKSHARFELYRDGMTVQEAMEIGITVADLNNDTDKKFISIA